MYLIQQHCDHFIIKMGKIKNMLDEETIGIFSNIHHLYDEHALFRRSILAIHLLTELHRLGHVFNFVYQLKSQLP